MTTFDWKRDGAYFIAQVTENITLCVSPENLSRNHPITPKPARGTLWCAQASIWDEATRCISRLGRDEYMIKHKDYKSAMRAAERIYLDFIKPKDNTK